MKIANPNPTRITRRPTESPALSQERAEPAGRVDYPDGTVSYYLAVDESTHRGVVYVASTRPDPSQALRDAPKNFTLEGDELRLEYRLFRPIDPGAGPDCGLWLA